MLAELQKTMAASLSTTSPSPSNSGLYANYSEAELSARLSIYRNNYFFSLTDVLKDIYPSINRLVGDDFFTEICRTFIEQNPPCSPVLTDYGRHFPAFIAERSDLQHHAYMPDVAKLDLKRHLAYYAVEQKALGLDEFSQHSIETIAESYIRFHPSLSIQRSDFAIYSIWLANFEGSNDSIEANKAEAVLIHRQQKNINTTKISTGFYTFLKKLIDNFTIGEALQLAQEADTHFDTSEAIRFLINSGISTGLTCNDVPEDAV